MTAEPPLPRLDDRRCTGCGDCARACPAACLELLGRLAWLPRPADCIRCGACELVCPADAVVVPASGGHPGAAHHQTRSGSTSTVPQ